MIEVGASTGALTAKLLDWAVEHDAPVHSIDPRPQFDVAAWRKDYGKRFVFHKGRSLNVLGRITNVDVAFVDGDHNWYTVIHELRLLERTALAQEALPPLVALHDVDWPYGRRDLYYDPDAIPAAHRQPYELRGIRPGEGELGDPGLNDQLNNAIYEHSIHNGVRTAIEDFVAESELSWELFHVPGLHGLGILVTPERLAARSRLGPLLRSFQSARFLRQWCEEIELARVGAEIAIATRARALAQATERAEELGQAEQKLRDELERVREELEQRTSDQTELARRLEDLQAALDRAAAEREQTQREHEAAREQAEREQQHHSEQRAELERRLEDLQAALDQAGAEREQAVAERTQVHDDIGKELAAGRAMREELGSEIERLEHQLAQAAGTEAELRQELIAARAQAEEADEQRHAARSSGAGANDGAPLSPAGAIWTSLAAALRSCDEGLSATIADRDPTFGGDRHAYLEISRSALGVILPALAIAGIARPAAILDLPSGYGRVTRALRAAWPEAELVAADQSTAAIAFCVEQFGAEGWTVGDYLALDQDAGQLERYDLIWTGSLLSSIDPGHLDACLGALMAMLRADGVLVAAYHGRDSTRRFSENADKGLRTLARSVDTTGVGFRARENSTVLGTAAMTPQWLLGHLTRHRTVTVLSVTERGWADHLDIVALTRRDIHHAQRDLAQG